MGAGWWIFVVAGFVDHRYFFYQKLEASKAIEPPHSSDAAALDSKMAGARAGFGGRGGAGQHVVISDPNRMVPVQITIPAQQGNPTSQPRALTVQVAAAGHTKKLFLKLIQFGVKLFTKSCPQHTTPVACHGRCRPTPSSRAAARAPPCSRCSPRPSLRWARVTQPYRNIIRLPYRTMPYRTIFMMPYHILPYLTIPYHTRRHQSPPGADPARRARSPLPPDSDQPGIQVVILTYTLPKDHGIQIVILNHTYDPGLGLWL